MSCGDFAEVQIDAYTLSTTVHLLCSFPSQQKQVCCDPSFFAVMYFAEIDVAALSLCFFIFVLCFYSLAFASAKGVSRSE
jgi:hypothetical protein